jgi:RNA polymerase sigma factor (sigma-70 family)
MRCPHGARYAGKSDEQLMVEFYGCDDKAFEELWWCRWRNKMGRYVARRVPIQDVDDILQNAAIKVLETKHRPSTRYDPHKGPLQPWLFKVVENVLRDHFRSEHFGQEVLWSDLQAEIMEEGEEGEVPDPLEFAADEIDIERVVIIRSAVHRLSEPSRTIVQQRFWGNLTIKEIAEELGMPLATVHRKLGKDLERLREIRKILRS